MAAELTLSLGFNFEGGKIYERIIFSVVRG
jgi:hypothetical protein